MEAPKREGRFEMCIGRGGCGKTTGALRRARLAPPPGLAIAYGPQITDPAWTHMTPSEWHRRGMPDLTVWMCSAEEALQYAEELMKMKLVRAFVFDEAHRIFSKDLGSPAARAVALRMAMERRHLGAYIIFVSQRPQGLSALEDETDFLVVHRVTSRYVRNTLLPEYDDPESRIGQWPARARGASLSDVLTKKKTCHSFVVLDLKGINGGDTYNACDHNKEEQSDDAA